MEWPDLDYGHFSYWSRLQPCYCFGFSSQKKSGTIHFFPTQLQPPSQPRSDGHRYSDFKIYSNGDYGILEFGNLRIAVKGETFRDSAVGENVRFTGHKKVAGYDLVGHGIKFEKMTDAKGAHFQFVGLSFTMVNSKIKLLGESVQADGQPTLVLVRDGNAKVYTSDTIDFE